MERRNFFASLAGGIAALFGLKSMQASEVDTGIQCLERVHNYQEALEWMNSAKNMGARREWRVLQGFEEARAGRFQVDTVDFAEYRKMAAIEGSMPWLCGDKRDIEIVYREMADHHLRMAAAHLSLMPQRTENDYVKYPCGCSANGPGKLPRYCPTHAII